MTIVLARVARSEAGTFGVLVYDYIPFAVTLELPWRANEAESSCIPSGEYACRRIRSPKFGDTFEVCDVPNRSHILLHRGNAIPDTQGCILVAEEFTVLDGNPAIGMSAKGFDELLTKTRGMEQFTLSIIPPPIETDRRMDAALSAQV